MGLNINVLRISILLLFTVSIEAQYPHKVFDITRYGAIPNERRDCSQALLRAWTEACSLPGINKVFIPRGKYLLGKVKMSGPCKGNMTFEIQGTLRAPINLDGDSWVTFQHIDRFMVFGGGAFDGQGRIAWKKNNCGKDPNCKPLPISLRLNSVNNSMVQDIACLNSKNFHVNLLSCNNLEFRNFRIHSPEYSVNTDGIHVGRSSNIRIIDSRIATGDDCISIGDGTHRLNVTGVVCGPGHGISIGSLGRYPDEQPVSDIYVSKCKIFNTDNGVRIKSWPALFGNIASNLRFEDIVMNNVSTPILIDQMYCPWNRCNPREASKVKISNVSFKNIRGNSSSPNPVQLLCSSGIPCENVELEDIDLKYNGQEIGPARTEYTNVQPRIYGKLNPRLAAPKPTRRLMFLGSM